MLWCCWCVFGGCDDGSAPADADGDVDADADGAADGDADSDGDGDADLDADTDTTVEVSSEESAFGIFAGFSSEFDDFERAAGMDHAEYLAWAGEQYRALGASWTRSNVQLIWEIVEPQVGEGYVWDNEVGTDDAFTSAAAAGVHYLAVFNEGVLRNPSARNQLVEVEAYQRFVRAVVERYDGDGVDDAPGDVRIHDWQVGNETMVINASPTGAEDYVRWFTITAEAVREADPEAKVVVIATADSSRVDDLHREVLPALVEQGVRFDAVDIHHWGRAEEVEIPAVPAYRVLFEELGLSDVEIWSGEHGTYVGQILPPEVECIPVCTADQVCAAVGGAPRCVDRCASDADCLHLDRTCHLDSGVCTEPEQSLTEQARSLVQRYVVNRDLGVRRILWNNLVSWHQFMGQDGGIYDRIGLVSGGFLEFETPADCGQPRPAWFSFQRLAARTDETVAERLGPVEVGAEDAYVSAYRDRQSDLTGWVGWSTGGEAEVQLELATGSATVTSLITDADGTPTRDGVVDAVDGQVTVMLGADPVWIEPVP